MKIKVKSGYPQISPLIMKPKTTKQRRFYPSAVLYVSTNTVPKNSLSGSYLCAVVEARGIEPLSEDRITGFSPSAGRILDFPCPSACERAMGLGSFILPASPQSLGGLVPHINDAEHPGRGKSGVDGQHYAAASSKLDSLLFAVIAFPVFDAVQGRGSLLKFPTIPVETSTPP